MSATTTRAALFLSALLAGTFLGACNEPIGASATATDPEASAKWSQFCDQESARQTSCGASIDRNSCLNEGKCVAGAFRGAVVEPLIECLEKRPCGQGDDPCFAQAASLYQNDPAVASYFQMCMDKRGACGGTGIPDDYCGNLGLVVPGILSQMSACLSHDCSDVRTCLDSVLMAAGCG